MTTNNDKWRWTAIDNDEWQRTAINNDNWQQIAMDGRRWRISNTTMTTKKIDGNCDNNTAEQSTVASCAAMVCKKEERIFFFTLCFFKNYLLPLELLQGQLTTWLQSQKHTRLHNLDANVKSHVQRKQMYVGLHHMMQILYYNQTLCVYVCVRVPKT